MLLNIKVFTDLLDAKLVQKLTGVTYFRVSNMATVLKSERGTPIKQRLIIRHLSTLSVPSVANGGMAVFRLRFTALSEYCRSHGRI